MNFDYDVLIVGGGPAGLSAALSLSRMRRRVLLCDDARPRNARSAHLNNFPTRDGIHPQEWRALAKADVEKYRTTEFSNSSVNCINKFGVGFEAELSSAKKVFARKIILAEGIQDRWPEIAGLREHWGHGVFHCPYCHGYEVRDKKLALLSNGEMAKHMLPMLRGLSEDLTLLTHGKAELDEDFKTLLKKNKIDVIETKISKLSGEAEELTEAIFEDGSKISLKGLFMTPLLPFQIKSRLGIMLGCELSEMGFYKLSERGQTTVPGVFAAGDNASMMQSVLMASSAGSLAAAGAVFELLHEDFHK